MRKLFAALAALVLVSATAACGLGTAGGYSPTGHLAGPIKDVDMSGATVGVGSKNFSEQVILGKMAVILLQSAGAHVKDLTNIPGSNSAREALLRGDITYAWEYTGTAWVSYLGHDDPIPDEKKQFDAVRNEDAEHGLVWLGPAPMNNTYAFATPRKTAERLGITKMSQLASLPPAELSFCVESEFNNRNDGFQPMLTTYDIPKPPPNKVSILDTGSIYAATAGGTCNFGEVFTTDGRILALDLTVLEDDRQFFPKYNLSGVVYQKLYDQYPQIRDLMMPVSDRLTNDVLQHLNAEVDVDGKEPVDVAWEWLKQEGFVTE